MYMSYYDSLNKKKKEYFNILSDYPNWLDDYIDTPALQRIGYISYDCGNDYTNLFPKHEWHSNLDHSVGVALILWHFTHDKKQTLAGLFHDIATPVFKHCIDFMNNDYENQESTEELTRQIIMEDEKIMELLKRDNITVDEVADYKIYPLADNNSPRLSADRFEYNFCAGYFFHPIWTLEEIKKVYDDVKVFNLPNGEIEMGFADENIALDYIKHVVNLWPHWFNKEDRIAMQFLADMCRCLNEANYLTIDDLYKLKESEVIDIIKKSDSFLGEVYRKFEKAEKAYEGIAEGKYSINIKSKRRYIDPLVSDEFGNYIRLSEKNDEAKKIYDNFFDLPVYGPVHLDFDFKPDEYIKKLTIK